MARAYHYRSLTVAARLGVSIAMCLKEAIIWGTQVRPPAAWSLFYLCF